MDFTKNDAGRLVPTSLGNAGMRPYKRRSGPWKDTKIAGSLEGAIRECGLRDGMTISFHHALRNGDRVMEMVLNAIAGMGIKDLRVAWTAVFKAQEPLIEHIKSGVISRIEGSCNGPIGAYITRNPLKGPVVLRSHGGRARAVVERELPVDVAFISASEADKMGNCNGQNGRSAFGPLGFAFADAWSAKNVVVVTDDVQPYPVRPISIQECYVDHIVEVDSIGEPQGISSGTTKVTDDPDRLRIAEQVVDMIELSGLLKDGFSFQAGAGGTSLAVVKYLHERMRDRRVTGAFAVGGVTRLVTDMLHDGTIRRIIDAQAFDLEAVESLREDREHVEVSHYHLMNPSVPSCVVHSMDVCFLGATEVDVDFNVNVNTHSDGQLLHGIGGHQDAAAGARISFMVAPVARKSNPIVRDRVTTITTPGQDVDVIVTDRGIAINPERRDLLEKAAGSKLDIRPIEELRDIAYEESGGAPAELELEDDLVAVIQYRDGSLLDVVRKPKGLE